MKLGTLLFAATLASAASNSEKAQYLLPAGGIETGGFFGANAFTGTVQPNPSVGGRFAYGLPHGFALVGEGAWNRALDLDFPEANANLTMYDLGGGLEWTPFRLGRFAPYLHGGVSWVRLSASGRFGQDRFSSAANRAGGNLGLGSRIYLNERYGVLLDVRAIQGPNYTWFGRVTTGLFFQFE
ncbi:MAG: porin family protein [bacterium]|nr:porin family protein [bacterium]